MDLDTIARQVQPFIEKANIMLIDAWNQHHFTEKKKDLRDIVTTADVMVEDFLRENLRKIIPEAGFIVEEGTSEKHTGYNWAIDPIDGTKYFANRVPMFYCQVALLKDTEPIISFVSQPIAHQLFKATKGGGAYLNDVRLPTPSDIDLSAAIMEIDSGPLNGPSNRWKLEFLDKLCSVIYRPRLTGGHLSLYLTTGAIDASINFAVETEYSVKNIVDLAPHKLIITESGYSEEIITFQSHNIPVLAQNSLISQIRALIG